MTARAGLSSARVRARHVSRSSAFRLLASIAALAVASPASAEIGAAVSVFSDSRFRGISVSDGNPVATFDFSLDDRSGAYFAASGTAGVTSHEVNPVSLELNAGFAREVSPDLTFDIGLAHSSYQRYPVTGHGSSYSEIYAGLSHKTVIARVHLSPHYLEAGRWTAYGELDHSTSLTRNLSLNSHLGLLMPVHTRAQDDIRSRVDWRIGLDRQLGRFALHAAFTGARDVRHYEGHRRGRDPSLVLGASFIL